jgi:hypothetical protein
MAPRRLEAEALRDAMLAVSGQLDPTPSAGSPVAALPVAQLGKGKGEAFAAGVNGAPNHHRSVYLPILRDLVPEVLDAFDFAEPTMVTGNRDVTTVSTQALYLMNNPFVIAQAKGLANRVQSAPARDDADRIELTYQYALARPPTSAERQRALQYLTSYAATESSTEQKTANPRQDAWVSLCQAIFAGAEFRYVR